MTSSNNHLCSCSKNSFEMSLYNFRLAIFLQPCVDFNLVIYIQVQLHVVIAIATETRMSSEQVMSWLSD